MGVEQKPNNQERTEVLTPLDAAREFTQICEMLDERFMTSFKMKEDWEASGKRIYEGNPTRQLQKLISQYYAGTPTARAYWLKEGFLKHGYNMSDLYDDIQFGSFPRELGMDVKNGNPGAFVKEGAKKIEREDLIYWKRYGIWQLEEIEKRYGGEQDEIHKRKQAFVKQALEYEGVFGEPFYTPQGDDSATTQDMTVTAKNYFGRLRSQLQL